VAYLSLQVSLHPPLDKRRKRNVASAYGNHVYVHADAGHNHGNFIDNHAKWYRYEAYLDQGMGKLTANEAQRSQ
jgi:hypothetical protein